MFTKNTSKAARNELRKLTATFLNNIAVGCVLLGIIAPGMTGYIYLIAFFWGAAVPLHLFARALLWHLED
jgi:hypothetical protein